MPKLSVIVPVYNGAGFVLETLNSILTQSFTDFELLVVDDGSSDETPKIINELAIKDTRIRFISLIHDGAPGHCRNAGLKEAKGKYIIFFDSDDIMNSWMLEAMYQAITLKKSDIVIGNVENYDVINKINVKSGNEAFFAKEEDTLVLNDYFTINPFPCNKMYDINFLRSTNVLFLEKVFNQDLGFFLSVLFYNPKISIIKDKLMEYRIRPNSITTSSTSRKKHIDILKVFDQVFIEYEKCGCKEKCEYGIYEMFIKTMMYKASYFNPLKDIKELKMIRAYLYKHSPNWDTRIEFKNYYSTKKQLYNKLLMKYQMYFLIGTYKEMKSKIKKRSGQ